MVDSGPTSCRSSTPFFGGQETEVDDEPSKERGSAGEVSPIVGSGVRGSKMSLVHRRRPVSGVS